MVWKVRYALVDDVMRSLLGSCMVRKSICLVLSRFRIAAGD